jgi:hypothetical protein
MKQALLDHDVNLARRRSAAVKLPFPLSRASNFGIRPSLSPPQTDGGNCEVQDHHAAGRG